MKQTNHTLPEWFDGTVYDEGDVITNPFTGEAYELNAGETSMYDFITVSYTHLTLPTKA